MSEEKKSLFKFRAWLKSAKKMVEVLEIDFYNKEVAYIWTEQVSDYELEQIREVDKIDDLDLMQSTGLKDKNGVEIFEGDIIKYTWDNPIDISATEKGKKVRISKVFWSDWRASWAVGKKSANSDLFRYIRNGNTVEVIGNIWEDEELLKMVK